jgi:hypothetical protein
LYLFLRAKTELNPEQIAATDKEKGDTL